MNDPLARLPVVPSFTVTSTDVTAGQALPAAQMSGIFGVPGGKDLSPQLSWSGAPAETKSYTVTMYDPDAPSGSGFWHWAVADIPASVTGLPAGAGNGTGEHLPTGAFHLPNDARLARFTGAAPPPGDGRHRYVIVVQAIGIERVGQLQVQADSTAHLGRDPAGLQRVGEHAGPATTPHQTSIPGGPCCSLLVTGRIMNPFRPSSARQAPRTGRPRLPR